MSVFSLCSVSNVYPYYVINSMSGMIPVYDEDDKENRLKREGVFYSKEKSMFYSTEEFSVYNPGIETKLRKAKMVKTRV